MRYNYYIVVFIFKNDKCLRFSFNLWNLYSQRFCHVRTIWQALTVTQCSLLVVRTSESLHYFSNLSWPTTTFLNPNFELSAKIPPSAIWHMTCTYYWWRSRILAHTQLQACVPYGWLSDGMQVGIGKLASENRNAAAVGGSPRNWKNNWTRAPFTSSRNIATLSSKKQSAGDSLSKCQWKVLPSRNMAACCS